MDWLPPRSLAVAALSADVFAAALAAAEAERVALLIGNGESREPTDCKSGIVCVPRTPTPLSRNQLLPCGTRPFNEPFLPTLHPPTPPP